MIATRERDLHPALEDHVQVGPGVVLTEDHLAAPEALRADAVGKLGELAVRES